MTASLPASHRALLIRTDFTDDRSWEMLCVQAMSENADGFSADVLPVNDPSLNGMTWQELEGLVPRNDHGSSILFVADSVTMSSPGYPVLVATISRYRGGQLEPFRCMPSHLWSVENNLNLFNMDWGEFIAATDDGVFRGF